MKKGDDDEVKAVGDLWLFWFVNLFAGFWFLVLGLVGILSGLAVSLSMLVSI